MTARYLCDNCRHIIGLPSAGSNVVGLSCGNCDKHFRISYPPEKLVGVVSEWRCPTCNGDKGRCFRVPRFCPVTREKRSAETATKQ